MKKIILMALLMGSFCQHIHAMQNNQNNLLARLQSDADQTMTESFQLLNTILQSDRERLSMTSFSNLLSARVPNNQPQQPAEPTINQPVAEINIDTCWRDLLKKAGALEYFLTLNIAPAEDTEPIRAGIESIHLAYEFHMNIVRTEQTALLIARAASMFDQHNQN